MRRTPSLVLTMFFCAVASFGQAQIKARPSLDDVRANGVFGFPQQYGQVICDRPELRVSVYNSDGWIFVQAILWDDGEAGLGKTYRGEAIGDTSALSLHLDEALTRKPYLDRNYYLNPWPSKTGLYFSVVLDEKTMTTLKKETENRGELRYLDTSEGRRIRVDNYMIPMIELDKKPGDTIRLTYYAYSPRPEYWVDSSSSSSTRQGRYAEWQTPLDDYSSVVLQKGNPINFRGLPSN